MARATKVPESVDSLFSKKGQPLTEFDRYIEQRAKEGDTMSDLVLIIPSRKEGNPQEVETRYGRISYVLPSEQVDRCYLLSVREKPGEEFEGVCKRAREGNP